MGQTVKNTDVIHVNKTPVRRYDLQIVGWGMNFYTDSELDAYKAAYAFQNRKTKVEYARGVGRWMVTVFEKGFNSQLDTD